MKLISINETIINLGNCKNITSKEIKLNIQNYLHYVECEPDIREVIEAFIEEPIIFENIPQYVYAYFAGIVECKSLELKLEVPFWIYKPYYFLDEDWFPEEIQKLSFLKKTLRTTSPEYFKKRRIYVSRNAISIA